MDQPGNEVHRLLGCRLLVWKSVCVSTCPPSPPLPPPLTHTLLPHTPCVTCLTYTRLLQLLEQHAWDQKVPYFLHTGMNYLSPVPAHLSNNLITVTWLQLRIWSQAELNLMYQPYSIHKSTTTYHWSEAQLQKLMKHSLASTHYAWRSWACTSCVCLHAQKYKE